MTSDLPRLKDGRGPARLLLRSADLDRPNGADRQRALAVASALTILSASGAAAAGTGTVVKGVLFWVCVGAAGGSSLALITSKLVDSGTTEVVSAAPPRSPVAPAPNSSRVGLTASQLDAPSPAPARTAFMAPGAASSSLPAVSEPPTTGGHPMASAASFGDDVGSQPSLFEELRLIEAARAALARGTPGAALSVLDNYDRSHATGQFQPEALALRIQALSQTGDKARARELLTRFRARYPNHPLLQRAVAAAGE